MPRSASVRLGKGWSCSSPWPIGDGRNLSPRGEHRHTRIIRWEGGGTGQGERRGDDGLTKSQRNARKQSPAATLQAAKVRGRPRPPRRSQQPRSAGSRSSNEARRQRLCARRSSVHVPLPPEQALMRASPARFRRATFLPCSMRASLLAAGGHQHGRRVGRAWRGHTNTNTAQPPDRRPPVLTSQGLADGRHARQPAPHSQLRDELRRGHDLQPPDVSVC